MTTVNLKCVDNAGNADNFTVGNLYKNVWLHVVNDKVKSASIVNDGGKHNIGPAAFNSVKELQTQRCAFKIALTENIKESI